MHDVAMPSPSVKSILEATTEDGNALLSACNIGLQGGGGRKVHLRVGQMDASVPPWQVIGVSVVVVAPAVMIVVVMIIIVTMTTLIRGVFPQVRKMARALQLCGADVTYEEVAGKVSRAGGRSLRSA